MRGAVISVFHCNICYYPEVCISFCNSFNIGLPSTHIQKDCKAKGNSVTLGVKYLPKKGNNDYFKNNYIRTKHIECSFVEKYRQAIICLTTM